MADTMIVRMAQRGALTLPKALRDSYNLQPGDSFTLLDLGAFSSSARVVRKLTPLPTASPGP